MLHSKNRNTNDYILNVSIIIKWFNKILLKLFTSFLISRVDSTREFPSNCLSSSCSDVGIFLHTVSQIEIGKFKIVIVIKI